MLLDYNVLKIMIYQHLLFYEKKKKWLGAQIYYNDVLNILKETPENEYADQARKRIEKIQLRRGL